MAKDPYEPIYPVGKTKGLATPGVVPATFHQWADQLAYFVQQGGGPVSIVDPLLNGFDPSGSYTTTGTVVSGVNIGTAAFTVAANGYFQPGRAVSLMLLTGTITVTVNPAIITLFARDGASTIKETASIYVPVGTSTISSAVVTSNTLGAPTGMSVDIHFKGSGGTTTIARPVASADFNLRISSVTQHRPFTAQADHLMDPTQIWL